MLDLRKLAEELIAAERHCDKAETARDEATISAIRDDQVTSERNKAIVDWLRHYKILMSFTATTGSELPTRFLASRTNAVASRWASTKTSSFPSSKSSRRELETSRRAPRQAKRAM